MKRGDLKCKAKFIMYLNFYKNKAKILICFHDLDKIKVKICEKMKKIENSKIFQSNKNLKKGKVKKWKKKTGLTKK